MPDSCAHMHQVRSGAKLCSITAQDQRPCPTNENMFFMGRAGKPTFSRVPTQALGGTTAVMH